MFLTWIMKSVGNLDKNMPLECNSWVALNQWIIPCEVHVLKTTTMASVCDIKGHDLGHVYSSKASLYNELPYPDRLSCIMLQNWIIWNWANRTVFTRGSSEVIAISYVTVECFHKLKSTYLAGSNHRKLVTSRKKHKQ